MITSHSKAQKAAWAIWIIASIFYAYQYVLRVMPNIMLHDIMNQFHINATTFGQFSGVYYLGYSLMHIPVGIMLDRLGPRKTITGCILLAVIGLTPLLFADHWIYPIIGRLCIGMGSSAAILGVFKIIRLTFSEERFPRMLSLSVTIGLIGAIYGGGPVSYMCDTFGYQAVIQMFAGAGLVLAAVTYCIVPEHVSSSDQSVYASVKEVLSNKKVIWSCICAGLMVGPLEGFADVWGGVFFTQVYAFDTVIAASLPSMMFIGMCFGSPVLNWIAEKVGNYIATVIGAGVVMTVSFCTLLMWQIPMSALTFMFVVVGVCCAYQILAIYKASTYVREQVAGLTTAVANMIIMTFGYLFHAVIGWVVHVMGGAHDAQALVYGVSLIPIALFIGTIGFFILALKDSKRAIV